LSIYSTRALFHKYCAAMKYCWICCCFVLSESPSLKVCYMKIFRMVILHWTQCLIF